MRSPEQVKWDFVQQWLDKARKDLAVGEVLLKGNFEDYDSVCMVRVMTFEAPARKVM